MRNRPLRVVVAAENDDVRQLLKQMVQKEAGTAVVGESETIAGVAALARSARPDVALLDQRLPHASNTMSPAGHPESVGAIGAALPGVITVLVNSPDPASYPTLGLTWQFLGQGHGGGESIAFTLRDLYGARTVQTPVFATIAARPHIGARTALAARTAIPFCGEAVCFGTMGMLLGMGTLLTIVFAPAGVVLVLLGAALVLFGLSGKLINRLIKREQVSEYSPKR